MSEEEINKLVDKYVPRTESTLFGPSTRFWLALIITCTACTMGLMSMKIEEPIYSAFLLTLGFYFGQKTKSP
jgi:hypothetical protein